MTDPIADVFLSYAPESEELVETLARRLRGDARLRFWFAPWHAVPGVPFQEQIEDALLDAQACAIFIAGGQGIAGWQNEQLRIAIQRRVEDTPGFRIIPVMLPGAGSLSRRDLPPLLRRYTPVEFRSLDDDAAFQRFVAGILGVPPGNLSERRAAAVEQAPRPLQPGRAFQRGHALLIGVAHYERVRPLGETVLNDVRDLHALLADPQRCGYPADNITELLDAAATGAGIRAALTSFAARTAPGDTALVFFAGHGARDSRNAGAQQYVLPCDCDPHDLAGTAISGQELTTLLRAVRAERLLVLLDCCHSGGTAEPRDVRPAPELGLNEDVYAALAQGSGRIVIASSRPDEVSWQLPDMRNGLFTHYLLEALRGQGPLLGDGYVRVFDLFRHVAAQTPTRAQQHPLFKAAAMDADFPIALTVADRSVQA